MIKKHCIWMLACILPSLASGIFYYSEVHSTGLQPQLAQDIIMTIDLSGSSLRAPAQHHAL